MKTIMLVCVAGMSTSLLVSKMQKEAELRQIDTDIFAIPESEVEKTFAQKDVDVLLLGPQVKYLKSSFDKKYADKCPVEIINMMDYGMMNGKNVLDQAITLIG